MYLLREHAVIGIIASKLERDRDAVLSREALLFPPFSGGQERGHFRLMVEKYMQASRDFNQRNNLNSIAASRYYRQLQFTSSFYF